LGIIGLHPLHFPPFVKVCFTPKHILLASWPLHSTLSHEPNVKVATMKGLALGDELWKHLIRSSGSRFTHNLEALEEDGPPPWLCFSLPNTSSHLPPHSGSPS
jgi:hypothetical protein